MTIAVEKVKTILIIDDEKEAARAVARYFRPEKGWRPMIAHSGEEAFLVIKETIPDVAIIDVRMPGMNGIELLKRLHKQFPDCVKVMLTAVDEANVATSALKNGASDYVRKPVILHDLEHTVLSAIEKENLRRENLDYQKNLENKVAEQTTTLRRMYAQLEKNNTDTVAALTDTIEAKDAYTRGHSRRVSEYAMALGNTIGLAADQLKILEVGALLHDIGKIGVTDEILHAPRKLSDEEYMVVQRHPVVGERIVENIDYLAAARTIIRHHHEKYGGGGYPDGLVGEEIDILARITGIADVYDALSSDRPYRSPFGVDKTIAMIREMAGAHLDPILVGVFIDAKLYAMGAKE